MTKNLVIVESPAKARTIGRLLGSGYDVKASIGHIRDLPGSRIGVDVENNFEPKYVVPKEKKSLVKELDKALKGADALFLATDPDREGEAIAWHLAESIKTEGKPVRRVVFHEITEPAIDEAFKHPRDIDVALVNAQQTRRILDRIVGYRLSPLLWKKVRRGLSAGRVQSVALRMVVERNVEIEKFVPVEYWRIGASLAKQASNGSDRGATFDATLTSVKGVKGKLDVHDEEQAAALVNDLQQSAYVVAAVKKRAVQRKPTAPFITSTLQQEAWRKLRFPARKTMAVAQQLYEGLALGTETMGLITYMRTDSPVASSGAIQETREYVSRNYGKEYVSPQARAYVAKAKGAQEAHEAIRPTSIARDPASVKSALSNDQFRLYDLVWKRMVTSQMANAVFDSTSVQIEANGSPQSYVLTASGSVQKFAGFLALYVESTDVDEEKEDDILPPVEQGEHLHLRKVDSQQKFTQPPPRYSEASLVKALEEAGIGRPSTYAPIISTIQDRGYVKKDNGLLSPESLGTIVNDLLTEGFARYIDPSFTAAMEEGLDEIARGEKDWVPFLSEFYGRFDEAVTAADEMLERREEPSDETCDLDGKPMVVKRGRFGLFLACTGYPDCKATKPRQIKVGVHCPEDGGEIVEKRSRKGRTFYGCMNYPNCTFATNLRPIPEPCPRCKGLLTGFPRGGVRCTKCEYKGKRPKDRDEDLAEETTQPEAAVLG